MDTDTLTDFDYEKQKNAASRLVDHGWGVTPPEQHLIDLEPEFLTIWNQVQTFTMTSVERGYALWQAVRYLVLSGIPGELVECGVWKGGSCMIMAHALSGLETERDIHLYDTFSGMTEPTEEDVIAWNGVPVSQKWEEEKKGIKNHFASWAVGLDQVRQNLALAHYPKNRFVFHPGDVARTLKKDLPEQISLLRLDTDWYESTKIELEMLYPRLVRGGILIIDDYGHFKGARQAVDEYFSDKPAFFQRIDYTGRLLIKP